MKLPKIDDSVWQNMGLSEKVDMINQFLQPVEEVKPEVKKGKKS